MRQFAYTRADSVQAAIHAQTATEMPANAATVHARSQYVAGGTTLIDLMKLDVMRPQAVTDINALAGTPSGEIKLAPTDSILAPWCACPRQPITQTSEKTTLSLRKRLSLPRVPQIRNMASLGGNVLQRTRCTYFRDTSYPACNKREPGSGCAAMDGINRMHAILGVSDQCIASYAGDFAQALIALDADVELAGPKGSRRIPFAKLHRPVGDTPHIETILEPGELILAFMISATPWATRSLYLKIRDRELYEFSLASAAVALISTGIQSGKAVWRWAGFRQCLGVLARQNKS